jgi:hypothetical protein
VLSGHRESDCELFVNEKGFETGEENFEEFGEPTRT